MEFRSKDLTDPLSEQRRRILRWLGMASFVMVAACRQQAAEPVLVPGRPMPDLKLPDLDGNLVQLSPAGGHALLVNFWATWCPPCRQEMAGLDRLYRGLRNRGLVVYGVSMDEDANLVREFVLREQLSFPVLHDHAGHVTQPRFGISTFPTTVLVRSDGLIAEVAVGERDWDMAPAEQSVRALL